MGGAMLQLSLYGSQDILLTGSPQVTFFRTIYKRHSLFSSEAISQTFQGVADFGRKCVCPLTKQGDLVTTVWLQVTLPDLSLFQYETPQVPTSSIPGVLSARYTSSTTAVNDAKWHNLVAVITTSTTIKANNINILYLDGNLISVNTFSNGNLYLAPTLAVDICRRSTGNYFAGNLSQMSIYNKGLTAAEIKQNFNALRGRYGI